jgi:hypothetical protein
MLRDDVFRLKTLVVMQTGEREREQKDLLIYVQSCNMFLLAVDGKKLTIYKHLMIG